MGGFLKGEVVEVVTYIMVGHVFLGGAMDFVRFFVVEDKCWRDYMG